MNGYNKVILMGTVGADAEVRALDGGNTVASMSIAVNESYTDKTTGERKQKTEWIRVEAWNQAGKPTGLASFLGSWGKKGQAFLIEGKMKTDSWEQDGITKYSTKVIANSVNFAGSSNAAPAAQAPAAQAPVAQAPAAQAPVAQAPVAQAPAAQAAAAQQTENYVDNNTFVQTEGDDDLPF